MKTFVGVDPGAACCLPPFAGLHRIARGMVILRINPCDQPVGKHPRARWGERRESSRPAGNHIVTERDSHAVIRGMSACWSSRCRRWLSVRNGIGHLRNEASEQWWRRPCIRRSGTTSPTSGTRRCSRGSFPRGFHGISRGFAVEAPGTPGVRLRKIGVALLVVMGACRRCGRQCLTIGCSLRDCLWRRWLSILAAEMVRLRFDEKPQAPARCHAEIA